MLTGWNWIGALLWIVAIVYLIFVIHFIRVRQLRLIVKTKKSFAWKNFWQYAGLLVIAAAAFIMMAYFTFFRKVDYGNHNEVTISTTYRPLVLTSVKDDFYYAQAQRRDSGSHPVISYSYWTKGSKYTVSGHNASVAVGTKPMDMAASVYPWNNKELKKQDEKNGKAFVAEMSVKYKNSFINGLGMRSGRDADHYTLIRVPSTNFVDKN
ncbi:LVIS_2131 family protein [Paucilactobacillus suebicus]|uniref:Uncharacterized protein n=1 Tax=Paucilactobacillus suebicus DSM 5007 = KCTC 3549 TaxID=1423807 RepID=A0A0R1W3M6_9LACO|nr:LVIS_2131 family protein [Paucilactobacillus suebicus]KRM12424.1 hypothetical protein FD16_GL002420 [Paucilactobacillus suebicus DSM 5007 = KCTC 3549]